MVTIYLDCARVTVYGDAFNQQRESVMTRKSFREQAIRDETGKMIGIVEGQPGVRGFFAHSIHKQGPKGKKFSRAWEAAVYVHALHDNFRDITT